ncbi:MAG: DUF1592 domain-containing protein [Capsulimonadales bacterium]|nr:DUF1592 domain-containing protein [Capsulimonadales bacterium]
MTSTSPLRFLRTFLTGASLIVALAATAGMGSGRDVSAGERVYRQQCASCHGDRGQGGPGYAAPLTGTRTVSELAKYIATSMPPGPKHCPPAEAKKVAAFIHERFYSPVAQERNRPATIALSRLTVKQFRNAVADLVGAFHPAVPNDPRRGLRGEYFRNRDFDVKERVLEREDPEVRFDFGTDGPVPGQFAPHHFSIAWSGSVLAPDTGEYEFIVRSEHAVRLYVNGDAPPLIDAWVKSGNDNEYRGSLFLLGGRAYPIRLEFSKSTIGVDDSEQKKGKPAPKASISLSWKRPRLTEEVIPQRCLIPTPNAPTFVVTSPFPPDDRSMGYERGDSVSKAWDEATTAAALETANYVTARLPEITGVPPDAPDRRARLKTFCRDFMTRAFRRPLSPEKERNVLDRAFTSADPAIAVKRVVLFTLKSPGFLYREIDGAPNDPYNIASRLSFGLWDTLPDPELLRAAAAGELTDRARLRQQAERMAADPRGWNKVREFLLAWLKVDTVPDMVKNKSLYPDFDPRVASDLRASLELTLENVVRSESSDYRELMMSRSLYLNGRLAKLYGGDVPADAPFQKVEFPASVRSGVLTHPYLLAHLAYTDASSPIHRGVLVVRNLLGRVLQPPPVAVAPLAPSLHPNMTTRERVTLQTRPTACVSCHNLINPLGFTLERFDAIGRLRKLENGKTIDATGSYQDRQGKKVRFADASDLARYLSESEEAKGAFAEKMFLNLVKQPVLAYGPNTLPGLKRAFGESRYNIRRLTVDIMTIAALPPGAPTRSTTPSPTRKVTTR